MSFRFFQFLFSMLFAINGMAFIALPVQGQALREPDRGAPGDEAIQAYLKRETAKISARFAEDVRASEEWQAKRHEYVEQYYYMLGLSPRPEKSPLKATATGTFSGDGYAVEMVHYQSRPGLYVTGNLYRPAEVKAGEKLPAILYVCGHSARGRNGCKVAFQSHGIWFARHGYACLIVDTLQLGEIPAIHHGTYNQGRWWWHSRGYTSAGVEAWNGVRGIDYLVSRPDVDSERIGVTGISGGGAATFWVASADERVKVAVPVSGMADLEAYVPNRVVNGHCDCMFLHNSFQWPWTRIAGLFAPRPLLFVNSDLDRIFPMDANDRVINRLERLYSLYGASDQVDAVVSVGGHAYRKDLRQAIYRFFNIHLKGDSRLVTDSEVDIVSEGANHGPYPIAPEKLRVFPTDANLPTDQLNTTIDEHFVPLAQVRPPDPGQFEVWKKAILADLRRLSFGYFPSIIPAAKKIGDIDPSSERLQSEEPLEFRLRYVAGKPNGGKNILLVVLNSEDAGEKPEWINEITLPGHTVVLCEPRGIGATKWTTKNPPNYVERSHALLGRTVETGRVWDVIAAAKYLASRYADAGTDAAVGVAGKGRGGLIAAYAAVLENKIEAVTIVSPAATHMDHESPAFLNVLRVCDIPDSLGLIAPRPLKIVGLSTASFAKTEAAYKAAGATDRLTLKKDIP